MKKDNVVFLKHILDAINLIEDYLKDKEFQEFRNNHMLQDAVIRETVWDTATIDVPSLKERLEEILKKEENK